MYVAVYGSLREDSYNYERIQHIFPGNFELVKTSMLPGFKMYDLGYYPAVVKSNNTEDTVYVEIMDCGDDALEYIKEMEYGAGYSEININIDGYDCILFIMEEDIDFGELVEGGDYFKYLDKKRVINE